jgi:hypothetical protein
MVWVGKAYRTPTGGLESHLGGIIALCGGFMVGILVKKNAPNLTPPVFLTFFVQICPHQPRRKSAQRPPGH